MAHLIRRTGSNNQTSSTVEVMAGNARFRVEMWWPRVQQLHRLLIQTSCHATLNVPTLCTRTRAMKTPSRSRIPLDGPKESLEGAGRDG